MKCSQILASLKEIIGTIQEKGKLCVDKEKTLLYPKCLVDLNGVDTGGIIISEADCTVRTVFL